MASAGRLKRRSRLMVGVRIAAASAVFAMCWAYASGLPGGAQSQPLESVEWAVVTRADLDTTVVAGGDLQAVKETVVSCQVEDLADSDGFLIVSLISNGTPVKKGDELCRLDSSLLEETARLEEIEVNQTRSSHTQARLAVEIAKTALQEYQEGQIRILTQEYEGKLALARSDIKRQEDRLAWTETMFGKGYVSKGQMLSDRQTLARTRHELRTTEGELEVFRHFQAPKEIVAFKNEITIAEKNLAFASDRLKVAEERLAYCRKQITNCTIRAPHDGVVVHANRGYWWSRKLEPGMRVYQEQKMFKLPDLSNMEVLVSVHETMGPRVKVGMKAGVRVASLNNQVLPATVVAISQFPVENDREWDERLRHYVTRVRLDKTPPRILPFMSAIVEIDTGRVADALVIPVEAMSVVDGRPSCNVVGRNGLERRVIATRHATKDFVEVVEGLSEGERVEIGPGETRA
ncbi:MAG: efflux RND transporter periplasmic adaptor subunit [Paludisphaera borealis]|uniref:efflux RND transporter periplasmic adaptor subunit n=1 Tax=Paludisphaera borealis TaxID=1387353 RepID=UPI00284D2B82|nr:efflux RND transporter periplasmic adaptor subunit [Paludisphaera borealis]MDR3622180.1 efflux RND transporter periplasmic adaptor subunit [Paludisphaera borealis]